MLKPNNESAHDNSGVQNAITTTRLRIKSNRDGIDITQQELDGLKDHVQRERALVMAVKTRLQIQYLRDSLDDVIAEIEHRLEEIATFAGNPDSLFDISALYIETSALLKNAHALQKQIATLQKQRHGYWKAYSKDLLETISKSRYKSKSINTSD